MKSHQNCPLCNGKLKMSFNLNSHSAKPRIEIRIREIQEELVDEWKSSLKSELFNEIDVCAMMDVVHNRGTVSDIEDPKVSDIVINFILENPDKIPFKFESWDNINLVDKLNVVASALAGKEFTIYTSKKK